MIIFKKITVKNFLSFGNVASSMDLNTHKNTLISGKNGSGKSGKNTDAICFALYGKPYRSISKGQLVNSINQRNCEVEIEFEIGSVAYRVKRGIKPNIFEIYQNNVLVDQEAAVADYQGYLERSILKINYKTFCQVVVLGTASFVPFMQLSTSARRDVVEDVLDIAVFSNMNSILKSRIQETAEEIKTITVRVDSAKKETEAQKKLIRVIEEARNNRIQEEETAIAQLRLDLTEYGVERDVMRADITRLNKPDTVDSSAFNQLSRTIDNLEDEASGNLLKINTIHKLDTCPTCLQGVTEDHKHGVAAEYTIRNTRILADTSRAKAELKLLQTRIDEEKRYNTELNQRTVELVRKTDQMAQLEVDIDRRQTLVNGIRANNTDLQTERDKLKEIADTALSILAQKSELLQLRSIQDISLLLLKDSGIKSAIIREYVPILNKLINKYLGMFGFHVNFILDENFNETIKSRGRDDFSYSSFSEGEKRKIDTAILFAFRQVSELKNSANCNLLVLDEIGSENFDLNAKECFLEILSSIEGGNNFVISHSAPSHEAYDAVIKVEKRGDFSYMEFMQ